MVNRLINGTKSAKNLGHLFTELCFNVISSEILAFPHSTFLPRFIDHVCTSAGSAKSLTLHKLC